MSVSVFTYVDTIVKLKLSKHEKFNFTEELSICVTVTLIILNGCIHQSLRVNKGPGLGGGSAPVRARELKLLQKVMPTNPITQSDADLHYGCRYVMFFLCWQNYYSFSPQPMAYLLKSVKK